MIYYTTIIETTFLLIKNSPFLWFHWQGYLQYSYILSMMNIDINFQWRIQFIESFYKLHFLHNALMPSILSNT